LNYLWVQFVRSTEFVPVQLRLNLNYCHTLYNHAHTTHLNLLMFICLYTDIHKENKEHPYVKGVPVCSSHSRTGDSSKSSYVLVFNHW